VTRLRSNRGQQQFFAILAAVIIALGFAPMSQAAPAAQTPAGELCFQQPGVNACVAAEFRSYWEGNGGLPVFGYPLEAAKQEQTPEGAFLVQYFERTRLELHPENAAPYNILLGRANDEVLAREGRNWRDFAKEPAAGAGCVAFAETQHTVCGDFLRYWRSQGLNLGDRGVSARESLALWGLPLSQPQEEQNIDGDTVLTQHFERARMELHVTNGRREVLLTRLGAALVPLNMKIFAINDFHGQVTTGQRVSNRPVGGAAYLAAYIKQRRQQTPYSLTVNAGDWVGASPPVSALLQDQPAMDFANKLGIDVATVGNHEFDEGLAELRRLINGGAHPTAGAWGGVNFPYITANVFETSTGKTIFPPYLIKNVAGARIGFVGAVLKNTPEIVTASGVAGLEFRDEVETINAAAADLKKQGVKAIIVLLHQGGTQNAQSGQVSGPIVDIATRLDPEVDVVVSAHTHTAINADISGKLVTQALSYSTAFADISLTIDRAKRDIVAKKAEIVTTFNDAIEPDAEIATLVKKYEDQVGPLVNRVIGTTTTRLESARDAATDTGLGNLIADAQRAAMGTQMAFMNPGGIRAPIEAGEVTFGELFSVQPFGNSLVKMNLTGDQIYTLLNQQWQPQADGSLTVRILQISGLSYTYADANPVGQKVTEVRFNNAPIDRAATYSVTVNSFLADGGDAFTVLRQGTNRVGGPVDLDALIQYVQTLPQPFTYQSEGRIVKQ
jgi:5'-nucleotidase